MKSMKVPFVDLKVTEEEHEAMNKVLDSRSFILGDFVEEFEENFARYIGCKYAIGVGSGTEALILCLKALRIGEGDQIIVPANTYIATASAVVAVGADPVFVDCNADGFMSFEEAYALVDEGGIDGFIPVHMYGKGLSVNDIFMVKQASLRGHIFLVEDACQAVGACYPEKVNDEKSLRVGAYDMTCFSFYPSKNLGCLGDGGMITLQDDEHVGLLRRMRNHGQGAKGEHLVWGTTCRLDAVQAAVLNVRLKYLDNNNRKRAKAAALYNLLLHRPIFQTQQNAYEDDLGHVWHVYPYLREQDDRDSLALFLQERGVEISFHYRTPILEQPCAKIYAVRRPCPNAAIWSRREISLPMFPNITEDQIMYVCEAIEEFDKINKMKLEWGEKCAS